MAKTKPIHLPHELSIRFGALSPPIKDQLREQEIEFPESRSDYFDSKALSVRQLRFAGFMTDGEAQKVERRIFDKLLKEINEEPE